MMPDYALILIRVTLAYLTLLILARAMGKREISQMTFFDYIVGITIGTITGSLAIDLNQDFLVLLPAVVALALYQILTSYLSLKSKPIRNLIVGNQTMLINKGNIVMKNMRKERINIDELLSKLREKNVFSLSDVEYAFLETDGKISVLKKRNQQPATPSDLKLNVSYSGISHLIVEEGKINKNVLKNLDLTKTWLYDKLVNLGIKDIKEVMFAEIDESGQFYIDLNDESHQMIFVKLHKLKNDLMTYYFDTNQQEVKEMYKICVNKIKNCIQTYTDYDNHKELNTK